MIRPSRVVATVVVLALAGAAAWAWHSGSNDRPWPPASFSPSTTSTVVAGPARSDPRGPTTTTIESVVDVETTVQGALDSWGRFAVTGDLSEVEPWFAGDGPQMLRFREEAQMIAVARPGGPPYAVTFEPIDSDVDGDEGRVHAEVVFVRTGEPSQSFDWVIVLRRVEGRWWVWTVEEAG